MITDETIAKAVADALDKRARAAENLSEWKYRTAEFCGVDVSTIERTLYCKTCPKASLVANLCELFGPDFKNEIEAVGSYVSARRNDRDDAEQIVTANSIKDLRKLAPVLRAAADEIDEHAGKLRPKEAA